VQQRRSVDQEDDETAAFLLMIFLVAPLSWDHHLVYILPATVQVIALLARGAIRGKMAVLLTACLFLIAWDIPFDHSSLKHGWWTLLISVKFYPVLVLWLFFIHRSCQRARASHPQPSRILTSRTHPLTQKCSGARHSPRRENFIPDNGKKSASRPCC